MAGFFDVFKEAGISTNIGGQLGSSISKTLNIVIGFIGLALIIVLFWWINERRKYNIVIRGHDLRGNQDFEFDDKAREYIAFNRADLKLMKRKKANVIIPNLKNYRSMVTGQRVIHIFKFGAVNDYVVLDPQIVQDLKEVALLDNEGKPLLDEEGNQKVITLPKYELHTTESLNKEHSIRDLRDALTRFGKEDKVQKYGHIVAIIIISATIILSAWIFGHYMIKAGTLHLDSVKIATESLQACKIGGGGIIPQ